MHSLCHFVCGKDFQRVFLNVRRLARCSLKPQICSLRVLPRGRVGVLPASSHSYLRFISSVASNGSTSLSPPGEIPSLVGVREPMLAFLGS